MKKIKKLDEDFLRDKASKNDLRDVLIVSASTVAMATIFGGIIFYTPSEKPVYTSTAIIMEEGNVQIIDLNSYEVAERSAFHIDSFILYTENGNCLTVNSDSVRIITAEDSHKLAEEMAVELVSDDGEITYYGKNASNTLKLTL